MKLQKKKLGILFFMMVIFFFVSCGQQEYIEYTVWEVSVDDETQLVIDGQKAVKPADPTKEGYRFDGWTLDGVAYDFMLPVNENLTIISLWTPIEEENGGDDEYMTLEFSNHQIKSIWQAIYQDEGIQFTINVNNLYPVINTGDIGMNDNIEFVIQQNPSLRYDVNHTLSVLVDAKGDLRLMRANSSNAFSSINLETVKPREFNHQFTTLSTGYQVDIFIGYDFLKTTAETAIGELLFIPAMRNEDESGNSVWLPYREQNVVWSKPYTFLKIRPNSEMVPDLDIQPVLTDAFEYSDTYRDDKSLLENMAMLSPQGNSSALEVKAGNVMFLDRTWGLNRQSIPLELEGLSYVFDNMEGSSSVVTESGYVVVAVAHSGYYGLSYDLLSSGYELLLTRQPNLGRIGVYTPMIELTDYYIKWVEVGETIEFSRWNLVFFDKLDEEAYFYQPWVDDVPTFDNDFTGFETHTRLWQGVPSVEVTPGGRLFAGWMTGGSGEPRRENHTIIVYSDDDGITWNNLFVLHHEHPEVRLAEVQFWLDPLDRLWIFYTQAKAANSFNTNTYTWALIIDDGDAPIQEIIDMEKNPVKLFAGMLRNNPTVLEDGSWLAVPTNHIDEDYVTVFASTDNGDSWDVRGNAYTPGAYDWDEPMIVQKEDGSLWMLIRNTIYGAIMGTYSYDNGYTWTDGYNTDILNPAARFYIGRLPSGNLLMINNNHQQRFNMTAFISDDDGETWKYQLLLDSRRTTYPDVGVSANGDIFIVWDYERISDVSTVYITKVTEAEIMAGGVLNSSRINIISTIAPMAPVTEGTTLGSSPVFQATGGFDATYDMGTEESYVIQNGGQSQMIYFKDIHDLNFYVETELTTHRVLNQDVFPKLGIIVRSGDIDIFFYIDGANYHGMGMYTTRKVGYVISQGNDEWDWDNRVELPVSIQYHEGHLTKMALARTAGEFTLFINDLKVLSVSDVDASLETANMSVGFLTFNTVATFYKNNATKDITTIQEKVNQVNESDTLFIGDSFIDINHWRSFYENFDDAKYLNLGVSGARISYWQQNFIDYILNYQPERIVMHIGINDINVTNTPGQSVGNQLVAFFETIHAQLPETEVYFILISPSINFFHNWTQTEIANQVVIDYASQHDYLHYIDLAQDLLDDNGVPLGTMYSDGLHLSALGYVHMENRIRIALGIE